MTYAAEYSKLSPRSIGEEAVKFSETDSKPSNLALGFGQVYTVGQIQNAKVEFDMQTAKFKYGNQSLLSKIPRQLVQPFGPPKLHHINGAILKVIGIISKSQSMHSSLLYLDMMETINHIKMF